MLKKSSEIAAEMAAIVRELAETLRQLDARGEGPLPDAGLPEPDPQRKMQSLSGPPQSVAQPQRVVILPPESVGKRARLENLKEQVAQCQRCALARTRNKTVAGEGSANARVMFIGEGPGVTEDRTGRPFVGAAGRLLDKMLAAIRLRREDVFITNVVKCRPPGNREPYPEEIAACRPFLNAQLETLHPDIIVCLGRSSAVTMTGETMPMHALRQKVFKRSGYDVIVTYHPSFLLRRPEKKKDAWADMLMLATMMCSRGLMKPLPDPWWI